MTQNGSEEDQSALAKVRQYLEQTKKVLSESKIELSECFRLQKELLISASRAKSLENLNDDEDEPSDDEGNLYKRFNEDQTTSIKVNAKRAAGAGGNSLVPDQALLNELFEDDDKVEFLLATDEDGGKQKTSLKTMLPNSYSVRVLQPEEKRKLLEKQRTVRDMRVLEEKDEKIREHEATKKAVHKEGFMIKTPSTQKFFASPRRRWFVLSGSVLVYLASPMSKVPRNMIDLLGAQVEAVKNRKGPTGFEVRLLAITKTPAGLYRKRYRFCTPTAEDAIEWCTAIKNNIDYSKQQDAKRREERKEKSNPEARLERKNTSRRRQSLVGMDVTVQLREPEKTYYDLLKVAPSATDEVLKKVYRELAVNFHPDKNPDIKPDEFAEISRAYAVLKDPEKRAQYDLGIRVKEALRLGVVAQLHGDAVENSDEENGERAGEKDEQVEDGVEDEVEESEYESSEEESNGDEPPAYDPAELRRHMVEFYKIHNPDNLKSIDNLLAKFSGQEEVMIQKMCQKYKVRNQEREEFFPPPERKKATKPKKKKKVPRPPPKPSHMRKAVVRSYSDDPSFAFYLDEKYELLIWQEVEHGTELKEGYRSVEMRFVQKIFAGENYDDCPMEIASKCVVLHGTRLGCPDLILQLGSEEERDEMLDGLRLLRCDASMLFQQNFDKMKEEGYR